MAHVPGPGYAGLMLQLMPRPGRVGSASVSWTLVAVPTPTLVTVIVKPTGLPARTFGASGVLITVRAGLLVTQMPSMAVPPLAELVRVAVLLRLVARLMKLVWQAAIC